MHGVIVGMSSLYNVAATAMAIAAGAAPEDNPASHPGGAGSAAAAA